MSEESPAIAALETEIKARLVAPGEDVSAFVTDALSRLGSFSAKIDPKRQVTCVIDVASLVLYSGENMQSARERLTSAVILARELGDSSLLRRALTAQSVILLSTYSPAEAMSGLSEALDIALAISDEVGKVSCWINLGSAFYEAALYADAIMCAQKAVDLSVAVSELPTTLQIVARGNLALYQMHMHDYERGLETIRSIQSLHFVPNTPSETQYLVVIEGIHIRLLLALARVSEAAGRLSIAVDLASRTPSARSDISVACSEALIDVYSSRVEQGLSTGWRALEKARLHKPALRETLLTLTIALEKAGLHDRAIELYGELIREVRKAQMYAVAQKDLNASVPRPLGNATAVTRKRIAALLAQTTGLSRSPV